MKTTNEKTQEIKQIFSQASVDMAVIEKFYKAIRPKDDKTDTKNIIDIELKAGIDGYNQALADMDKNFKKFIK